MGFLEERGLSSKEGNSGSKRLRISDGSGDAGGISGQ